jgi:uncharacterized surface protein with fasciclin (FAS1) repeats
MPLRNIELNFFSLAAAHAITTANGVIHVIDSVMLPKSVNLAIAA